MADPLDSHRLSSPSIFLVRMTVFIALSGFVALILWKAIVEAFKANPGLNGVIVAVLFIGIMLAFRQVLRLFREIRWVNGFRISEQAGLPAHPPVLLLPMANVLQHKGPRAAVSSATLRSILDSVGMRLDEARDIGRYLTGLLVFLGLLGTFWGLLDTVGSVGRVIGTLKSGVDAALMFEDLKSGLAAPLAGMGISFSSSLFGLAGSLVLGFLDLQAGQAQNRFYNELEDWLTTSVVEPYDMLSVTSQPSEIGPVLERLNALLADGAAGRGSTAALANLAEGIQSLVHHMRSEQQLIRDWVEAQASREADMKRLLERLAREPDRL